MTFTEIATMISGVGIPYAYYQFPDNSGQQPPFICFYYTGNNDVIADNTNYQEVEHLVIELYTDNKDFDLEQDIKTALNCAGLVYSRDEEYLDSEKMFMVVFESDVIITEDNNG